MTGARSRAAEPLLRAGVWLALLAGSAAPAAAGETDPYYAWRVHLSDSSDELNAVAARVAAEELQAINLRSDRATLDCAVVARALTRRMVRAGGWHPFGPHGEDWGFDYAPDDNTEYREEYDPVGVWRYTHLWPLGALSRPVPSVEMDGVILGVDKLGHFFSEGRRYWRSYREQLAAGATRAQAERTAIDRGIRQEMSYFGWKSAGIFSYADLEANWQGFQYFRALCEGDAALLQVKDGTWTLRAPLDIRKYVNPCWDEAWNPNGLRPRHVRGIRRAMTGLCPVLRRPEVQERWARYLARGCASTSHAYLQQLVEAGKLPDPSVSDIEEICRAPETR